MLRRRPVIVGKAKQECGKVVMSVAETTSDFLNDTFKAETFWAYTATRGLAVFAGIAGSNPAGNMDVCLLWVFCVVK